MLDDAGLTKTRILASGGLDELSVEDLLAGGAPIDAFGVGTSLGVSADAPALETAYKLVEYDGRPVMKLSTAKATTPGAKQVFRSEHGDVIGLREETAPDGAEPLLVPVMRGGRRIHRESVAEARERFASDVNLLPDGAKHIRNPAEVRAALSPAAEGLTTQVSQKLIGRDHASEV
jgi:nicotinate phosphoribosyltransferase